ncbi:hypothetical protein ABZ413_04355 [Nocardia rhamnosiphila]|uniref:Uncharacterized protein n=1 Tax=Nocardia rhamnosiphila TaxID=426716 RepID=A0ABV2WJH5_9NOCA
MRKVVDTARLCLRPSEVAVLITRCPAEPIAPVPEAITAIAASAL